MAAKIPPPPFLIDKQLQQLNRWLLDIQSILNSGGLIGPSQVEGLTAAYAQLAQNTSDILALQVQIGLILVRVGTLETEVEQNTSDITTLQGNVATINTALTALQARNQILHGNGPPAGALGNDGDLYSNDTGGAGSNLYSKRIGSWIAIA